VYGRLLKPINGLVIFGGFLLAEFFPGESIADGAIQSFHVVNDVTFDGNGKPIITPRIVTVDLQDLDKQRKEEMEYEAARAALYQSDSVEDRVLIRLGLMRCGTPNPGQVVKVKSTREELIENARLTMSDVQLNALLASLLKTEATLTDRQVEDIFRILHEGGSDGWQKINAAIPQLGTIAKTARRNLPSRMQSDRVYVDLVRNIFDLAEHRLEMQLRNGVQENRLRDDISMKVLEGLTKDSKITGSDLSNDIQALVKDVRNSDVSKRWQ